jgi:phosphoglycolate phosphatase-like HAD superfamily hydrolase
VTTAWIFDMDGALLRLEVDIEEVRLRLGALFAPLGVVRPFRPILGRIYAAAREAGGDVEDHIRSGLAILDEWEVRGAADARPREGAGELLQALAARGHRLGLYTAIGRAAVAPALSAAGLPVNAFTAIVSRDDAAPKPDAAGLIALAARLGAEETWYVADHLRDVESARAAGIAGLHVAALRSSFAPEEKLRAAGAERVVGSLVELL